MIFTSPEPCPMCAVAIMNAVIGQVIIAMPDEPAGALGPGRLDRLPPLSPALAQAQGLRVRFVGPEQEHDEERLPVFRGGGAKCPEVSRGG
jgi:tRNA(Arg) A34 adenosine deaminase TadA